MARPRRPDLPDRWYHVMNRGIDHHDVFFDPSDRIEFVQRLADIHDRFGVATHAYCLMDNHYHGLVHCPCGQLSDAMQRLGSLYTRHVNDRLGRDGALFRGRFRSRLITDDAYLLAAVRYIHRNPLVLDGVDRPDQYRWSSHRTYLGQRPTPEWMRTEDVLRHFDGSARRFDDFVRADLSPDAAADAGVDRVRAMVEACSLVSEELDGGASAGRVARLAALAWADRIGAEPEVVMDALAIANLGALRSATHRARRRVAADRRLGEVVERAADLAAPLRSRQGSDPWRDQRAARAAS